MRRMSELKLIRATSRRQPAPRRFVSSFFVELKPSQMPQCDNLYLKYFRERQQFEQIVDCLLLTDNFSARNVSSSLTRRLQKWSMRSRQVWQHRISEALHSEHIFVISLPTHRIFDIVTARIMLRIPTRIAIPEQKPHQNQCRSIKSKALATQTCQIEFPQKSSCFLLMIH